MDKYRILAEQLENIYSQAHIENVQLDNYEKRSPKDTTAQSLDPVDAILNGKKEKGLKMGRFSWTRQMGPKCNHELYPYKRKAKGKLTQRRRREGNMTMETDTEGVQPFIKEGWQLPEA